MASAAYADARKQLSLYEQKVEACQLRGPIDENKGKELSAILWDIERPLSAWDQEGRSPEEDALFQDMRALHKRVARMTAAIGIDGSWGSIGVDSQGQPLYNTIVLDPQNSAILGAALDALAAPNEYLRKTIERYKVYMGEWHPPPT